MNDWIDLGINFPIVVNPELYRPCWLLRWWPHFMRIWPETRVDMSTNCLHLFIEKSFNFQLKGNEKASKWIVKAAILNAPLKGNSAMKINFFCLVFFHTLCSLDGDIRYLYIMCTPKLCFAKSPQDRAIFSKHFYWHSLIKLSQTFN